MNIVEDKPLFKEGVQFTDDKVVDNAVTESGGEYFPFYGSVPYKGY